MSTAMMTGAVTRGIRVTAAARYLPTESEPEDSDYAFAYDIVIRNEADQAVKLLSRHWLIIDGEGVRREVDGEGVVGQRPEIPPGHSFKYASFARLDTPWGTMEGSYRMRFANGEEFDVTIARFVLANEGG